MTIDFPPAADDLLNRLNETGVVAKFQLVPGPGVTIPPDLLAEAKAARLSLIRFVALAELNEPAPPIPSGTLPPLFAVLDSTGVRVWGDDGHAEGAAGRLLAALRAAWPQAVVHPLAARWAARVAEAGEAAGFRRLFADAVDVTRADLVTPVWAPRPAENENEREAVAQHSTTKTAAPPRLDF